MEVYSKGICSYNGEEFTGSLSDFLERKERPKVQKNKKQFFKSVTREVD